MKQKNTDPLYEWFNVIRSETNLPSGHGQRFLKKLAAEWQRKRQRAGLRVAAMVLVLISLGGAYLTSQSPANIEMEQFYQTEVYFQTLIQNQWENLPRDQSDYLVPINATQKQMKRLQEQYQIQMEQFQNSNDHPKLLKAMITNLQKQLEILQDLNQQIETLNTQNDETELL